MDETTLRKIVDRLRGCPEFVKINQSAVPRPRHPARRDSPTARHLPRLVHLLADDAWSTALTSEDRRGLTRCCVPPVTREEGPGGPSNAKEQIEFDDANL